MKKICLFIVLLTVLSLGSLSAQYNQIYGQPYPGGVQGLYTSTLDTTYPADYELADNFNGLTEPISKLTFYGATGQPAWTPGPPQATEPFKIKFYNFVQGWTQPPQPDLGILAPETGTYTVNLYDSYGDGWNGGALDVYVNNTRVLDHVTLGSGTGPEAHTFAAAAGDYIVTVFYEGSWAYENWYEILDPSLNVIATDGDNTQTAAPTGIGSLSEPPLLAPTTGVYSVTLWDDWGDGWNGGQLDVFVAGVEVLSNLTLNSGAGPETHAFSANAGDEIATVYTAGSYAYENWYVILDPNDAVLATDGANGQVPSGIGFVSMLVILEPEWTNPVASFNLPATTTWIEDLSWGIWSIYMFEVELPTPVTLADGWVSAQIDVDGGATQWFLWAPTSPVIDNLSWQRTDSKGDLLRSVSSGVRDLVLNDMAFGLFSGGNNYTPVELSSFTATVNAFNNVELTWVSQSEHHMNGYRVYRNTSDLQDGSILITPVLIPATNTSTSQTYSLNDNSVEIGATYYYWLEAIDYQSSDFHGPVSVTVEGNVPPVLPEITSLKNAYPNPFKLGDSATIEVAVKAGESGTLSIYNLNGQLVRSFAVDQGVHNLGWNGRDSRGAVCGSGIYFYKLSTPSCNQTRKLVIIK